MSTTAIQPSQKVTAIQQKFAALKDRALALVVTDQAGYLDATEIVKAARTYKKEVGFELDHGIQSARDHLTLLQDQKKRHCAPADEIEQIASQKAETWKGEERRKAAAEEARINEQRRIEAQRKADEERRQAEAEAEADRKRREKEIEEQRKAGELNKREADRLKKQAEADAESQKELAAKQAEETAANVKTVTVQPSVPKVAGIRARVNWKFKIVDATKIPRGYLVPDEVAIGATVRALKDKAKAEAAIPGIEVFSEDSI